MAAQLLTRKKVDTAIDFGSGAGFPGIPLAIYSPLTSVTLIESQNKKASFLKEAARAIGLKNVSVFAERGETFKGTADLVTFRAVEKFEQSSAAAAKLVGENGRLALLITRNQSSAPRSLPGFIWEEPIKVPRSDTSILLIGTRAAS
jgi:16S rRNA (guanine527-N7)-methyltransferase